MVTASSGNWQWLWYAGALAGVLFVGGLAAFYMTRVPGRSYEGPMEPLSEHELILRDELQAHVVRLAGVIGERNLFRYPALTLAADYIRRTFQEMGYAPRDQAYAVEGNTVTNVEAEWRGQSRPEEVILVGAHYDSVFGSPGANDNGSGVAALLVLARLAKQQPFDSTLRFVAFVNEEPPFFQTRQMGSQVYARESARRGERIVAMLSLETIGYFSERAGSQSYPFPFHFFYPNKANFIAFVGNLASRGLVRQVVAAFREHTRFPSQAVAAPALIPGISWSDQSSFWEEGYPGVMVTDTAFYRYPEYHTLRDTPERVDYQRLARVVAGLEQVLAELAGLRTKTQDSEQ